MTFCICHSSSAKSIDVAKELEKTLQRKIPNSSTGRRFQLEDETKAAEACRELHDVQFAVLLLDNMLLSILDHKKSKRLYAKIAEMLGRSYCGQIVFFALDVTDQRLQEFKEEFDNGDSMQLFPSLEDIANRCYQIYISIEQQNQSSSLNTGITAEALDSDTFNRMSVSSFQDPAVSCSGELVRPRPLVAVENTYSSGNMTSNSSGPDSCGGLENTGATSLNTTLSENLRKVQAESTTPSERFQQLTVSGRNLEAANLPHLSKLYNSENISPWANGTQQNPFPQHNGTLQNPCQQHTFQTDQMPQFRASFYTDQKVQQNHGYQQPTTEGASNYMARQNQIQGGMLGQPLSHHNSHGASSQWSFPQNGANRNVGHDHRLGGDIHPQAGYQVNIPDGYGGANVNNRFPNVHQANAQTGHGLSYSDNGLQNHGLESSQYGPESNSTDNNLQSFLTSYVRADDSVLHTGDGFCVMCKQKKELSLPVLGMRMESMPFASMANMPSYGPEAMPCLSGFGYCLQCAVSSIQKQSGAGSTRSIGSSLSLSEGAILSMIKSEEGSKNVQPLPLNIPPNSHQNISQIPQVPRTISSTQQIVHPNGQSRVGPVGHSNASFHPNAPIGGHLDRSTMSLPAGIDTGSSSRGEQRYSADGRSTSLPTNPTGTIRRSLSPDNAYPSEIDNTRVPPHSMDQSDQNGANPSKRNSGTCTSEDLESHAGASGVTVDHDGSGAENRVSVFELSQEVFEYIRDMLDYHDQHNWTDLASLHGWNYGQISALKRKWKKRSIDSPFEYLVHEFQNYTLQELKEDLKRIPRHDVLMKLCEMEQKGKLPQGCNGLFT